MLTFIGNSTDPRLTDYDTLLENIKGLKNGHAVQVPIYDFKSSTRIGYRYVLLLINNFISTWQLHLNSWFYGSSQFSESCKIFGMFHRLNCFPFLALISTLKIVLIIYLFY
jgi:hypothetical protein